ncbi:uncharacterized protein LOC111325754 [Stylophora pistillata]|uniref:uncharacterized protein LOC111325754 n=1 Tax=Stylophora pistillata TaxID=50429 RepID=UPI000C044418|nr:uncharacterized protein LOC111325754 [Stylophora pistillata]
MKKWNCIHRIFLYFFLSAIVQGRDSKTKNFYTSRAKGNDNWSCDQTEPCQTIWRAVSLASDGDVVYLDGTGTGKNPYSCHSTQNLGVYINKRLALIGTGPMLPQIRCSEGTSLTFNGSGNASQMNVTLSGLLVSDSLVYFHDLSVNIYGCQFIGSKHGVKFVMSNREVSDIVITDSNFFGNKECISVFVTGSRIGSPIIKQNLILKNSSMSGNTIADGGNFISLTESPDNNKTVNCFIAMETVTFSGNTYNSRGLVYLQFKNGDQYFRNHKVISMNNRPSSNKEVLLDLQRNSEFMFECQNVTISINSSNFISQNARTLNVSATNILLQISNSRFSVHRLARYGGVVSLRGSSECELKISNSSFINNTVILDNGGAIEAECTKVRCTLTSSTFTDNTAVNGNGGAVKLRVFSSSFNYLRKENDNKDNDLVVLVRNVTFNNCSALSGGALSIVYERRHHGVVSISNCLFISNGALAGKEPLSGYGGAIQVRPATDDKLKEKHSNINVIIGGSIFTNNTAVIAGGAIYVKVTDQSNVIIEKSEIEWSSGLFGGCTIVGPTSSLKILDCTFANNLANALAIFHNVKNVEIIDSSFVGNYPLSGSFGGALVISDSKKCEQEQLQQGSYAIIQNTTFKSNIAVNSGGAVYLANCKTNIRNCQFFNNFAPRYGAHVYALKTNSLAILDSIYMQTRNKPRLINGKNYSDHSSLIDIVDIETLVVYNTTVEVKAYSRDKALMMVTSIVGKVDLGNENFAAEFTCPVGSEIKINCMPGILNTPDRPCKSHRNGGGVSSIQLRCSVCEGNSYSLERGRAKGTQLVSPVQCHPCPFGADCTKNIVAKRDFWGFKEQQNSSLLRFTMCPMGYCSQPKEADFPEFNSCQGNRSGKLCGECKDNYVETLYSTQCIPSHWCNDYWFWPVALIYVFVMALYLTFRPPVVPWIKRQILWFKQNEPVGQDVNFEKGYMKILFYFYQAANLVLISGSSQLAIKDKIVQPLLGAFNFRSGFLQEFNCPFTGLTVVTEQLFLASHVVCTLLVICALYGVLCGFQRFRGKGNPSPGPYVGGILQTTLLGYTVIATKSFSLLRCVDIGGERRLFFDSNIVCFQWWQYLLMGFACGHIVPFLFVLLWGSCKLYYKTISANNFLVACFFPLPLIIYWSYGFLHGKLRGAVTENAPPSTDLKRYLEIVLYDSFKRLEKGSELSLCWESVMIGRRLILAALKSFVSDPLPRVVIMNLLCVLFLIHHTLTLPFRDDIANIIETISLASIVVLGSANVFFASFVSLGVSIDNKSLRHWWNVLQIIELVILSLVPICFLLVLVVAFVSLWFRIIVVGFRALFKVLNSFSARSKSQTEERRSLIGL